MAIQLSEIKLLRSKNINEGGTNGGRMNNLLPAASGQKNSVWPDVPPAERTAGSVKYQKLFYKVGSAEELPLQSPKLFIDSYTLGDDSVCFFPATQTDEQSGISGSELKYGAGELNATVLAGVSTIDVLVEDAALDIFRDGDTVRISDKADIGAAGNEEYVVISVGGVSYAGNIATLVFTPPLTAGYSSTDTRVQSVYEPTDIKASVASFLVSSVGTGDFDDTGFPIIPNSIGCIQQNWTLTFTSATAFTVAGDTVGIAGTGDTTTETAIDNPETGTPYWTMDFNGFSGVFSADDTITFSTSPSSLPFWVRREVPAGAGVQSANKYTIALLGSSSE